MSFEKGHRAGASKSLNKTITEIVDFLGDEVDRPSKNLRAFLHDKMGDLAESWYRKGFNRGHRESYKVFTSEGEVPVRLEAKKKRTLSLNQKRHVSLKSKIRKQDR